jgi:hypothetical protein
MSLTLPTIALAKELQRQMSLNDVHLVWLSEDGFTIAHTDEERLHLDNLEDCLLHQALSVGPLDVDTGWYRIVSGGESAYNIMPVDYLRKISVTFSLDI